MPTDHSFHDTGTRPGDARIHRRRTSPVSGADPRPGHPRTARRHAAAYRFTDWAMI